MTTPHDEPLYRLIREIRGAFNDLRSLSDAMNEDVGVTAAMRAVLEHLEESGAQTVPQIAAAKNVSRQHIQTLSDALAEKGLLRFDDNPAHKRSKLAALTDDGAAVFAEIRRREEAALVDLAGRLSAEDLEGAAAVVARLRRATKDA